jgi:UDP-hydrolysing UDP-N-acetyl-D-glucosamine 2-epimerase
MSIRKICVVVFSRANYGRIKSVIRAINERDDLELNLVVGASAALYKFGNAVEIIEKDGFKIDRVINSIIEGDTLSTMSKSTGLSIIDISSHFELVKPDIVLTVADRYETMATAIAASYMNIPLAHTQGGEVTGSIDESVRHAITKLAHIHFPATKRAYEFLLKMGEKKEKVFYTGCPAMDLINMDHLKALGNTLKNYKGIGKELSASKPYIVVLQHPVTNEYGEGYSQINSTLEAIKKLVSVQDIQIIWLWPNIDAGSDLVSKRLREFHENEDINKNVRFFRNFSPEDYLKIIFDSLCIVGNSSSGLREGSFIGLPCVNIGSRQNKRERGPNVIDVEYDAIEIFNAIIKHIQHGKYSQSPIFGDGNAGKKIARVLSSVDLSIKKELSYLES